MGVDIRISADLLTGTKFRKLERRLGHSALKNLVSLWSTVARERPDGILLGMDHEEIALAASWEGDHEMFVQALIEHRWLDRHEDQVLEVHDWVEHQPWVAKAPERSEKAKKAISKRWEEHRKARGTPQEYAENTTSIPEVIPLFPVPIPIPIDSPLPPEGEDESEPKPKKPKTEPPRFGEFWRAYPKKKSKDKAIEAWRKIRPDDALIDRLLTALAAACLSRDWTKDGGQFIPWPAKWLNERRWEDEIDDASTTANPFDLRRFGYGETPS